MAKWVNKYANEIAANVIIFVKENVFTKSKLSFVHIYEWHNRYWTCIDAGEKLDPPRKLEN